MLNEDYKDMLQALVDEKVKFILVGAYAMAAHGYPRSTMDIDLWVEPSPENAIAVIRAIERFGAPLQDLTPEDLSKNDTVFQIGVAPRRIDLLTGASGLQFVDAFAHTLSVEIEDLPIHILSLDDLIKNKKATGRTKDAADVEVLEAFRQNMHPPGS